MKDCTFQHLNHVYQNLQTYLFTTFSPAVSGQELLLSCCYGTWRSPALASLMSSHSDYHPMFNNSEYNLSVHPPSSISYHLLFIHQLLWVLHFPCEEEMLGYGQEASRKIFSFQSDSRLEDEDLL